MKSSSNKANLRNLCEHSITHKSMLYVAENFQCVFFQKSSRTLQIKMLGKKTALSTYGTIKSKLIFVIKKGVCASIMYRLFC